MSGTTIECAYLGGYQAAPASSQPIVGQLVLRESELRFEVMGEYSEVMFTVPWADVTSWGADGSNAASSSSAMPGRVLVGALVAGLPGAFIGSLAQRERYNTVLVVETARDRIGFAIKDLPPVAVEAALRRVPAVAEKSNRTLRPAASAVSGSSQWSYFVSTLDGLHQAGIDGWEAVGVWKDADGPRVLMKRSLVAD